MELHKFLALIFCVITTLHHLLPTHAQNSQQDYINAHNSARAKVGVGPLSWNTTLEAFSLSWSKQRISDCNLIHSDSPYGENLAKGYGSSFSGINAINLWVAEKPYYDYKSNTCIGGECLHYTQVVWRDSVQLGCARVQCNNGWMFVMCSYDPPGNYEGERPY